ncbi:MAG TPA: hypothetical protein VMV05_12395 [bacterium]|nr:hypothetical protein [bacterium]
MAKNFLAVLFLVFSSFLVPFVWAGTQAQLIAPTPVSTELSPTPTPWVIAQADPPPSAEHVGPAMRIVQAAPEKRLVLRPGSGLWVRGSTSQRTFELWAGVLLGSAILKAPVDPAKGPDSLWSAVKDGGVQAMSLVVPVENLKSGEEEKGTSKDYSLAGPYVTLKGKDNPYVQFRLEEETLEPGAQGGPCHLRAAGKLSIAGVTRDIRLKGIASFEGNQVRLNGVSSVRLADYNIQVLSKIWGDMGQKGLVQVHFDLLFGPEEAAQKGGS